MKPTKARIIVMHDESGVFPQDPVVVAALIESHDSFVQTVESIQPDTSFTARVVIRVVNYEHSDRSGNLIYDDTSYSVRRRGHRLAVGMRVLVRPKKHYSEIMPLEGAYVPTTGRTVTPVDPTPAEEAYAASQNPDRFRTRHPQRTVTTITAIRTSHKAHDDVTVRAANYHFWNINGKREVYVSVREESYLVPKNAQLELGHVRVIVGGSSRKPKFYLAQ